MAGATRQTAASKAAALDAEAAHAAAADHDPSPLRPVSGLDGKLALVLGEMERVSKTGYNQAQNYKFAQEGDVADMIRASLAAHGINYHVTMASEPRFQEIRSRSGTAGDRCHVHLRFTLTDADNPDDQELTDWWGYADDYQDKAVSKAVTGTKKSYLVTRFLVSTGEPEPDGAGVERAAPGQAQPAPAQAAPADRPATDAERRRIFAVGHECNVDAEFVRLSARLMTRTREHPHGRSISDLTHHELTALEASLRDWEHRPANWDERMGKLSAALAEAAEREAAAVREAAEGASAAASQDAAETGDVPPGEPEPDEKPPLCTCGVGDDKPAAEHADECPMAIPF